MNDINLLYCFDSGYDKQTFVSIYSILSKIEETVVNIFIIHKNPETFEKYRLEILKNKKIGNIEIYQFDKNISNYPNLSKKHVSEATYYRLFISDYLPDNLEEVIYIDSDVYCLSAPDSIFKNTFKNMKLENRTIGVSTEIIKESPDHDLFKNLKMDQSKYFNAGVMFIDYKKWLERTSVHDFLNLVKTYANKIIFWDQDILNKKFDGDYFEIDEGLNYRNLDKIEFPNNNKSIVLLHYVGNQKPWSIEGGFQDRSKIYFEYYQKAFNKKYHFEIKKNRVNSMSQLMKHIFTLNFLNAKYPSIYIFESLKTIFKPK